MSDAPQPLLRDRRTVTQALIWRYAEVSGANDPIHVDPDLARQSRFGGTVAQGLLVFAWLSELMMRVDAEAWSHGGRLEVTFRAPARPGDVVDLCCGHPTGIERNGRCGAEYDVWCENQDGIRVIAGRAWMPTDPA